MITLNVNKFLGALTNLIAYAQIAYTHDAGNVGKFVNSFQDINVENGDGKVILASDLLKVKDLEATSSLLTQDTDAIAKTDEQYIDVKNFKYVRLDINKYLMRGAFTDEEKLAEFLGYLISIMEDTKTAHMSDEIINKLCDYEPVQDSQKIEIEIIDTSKLTDPTQIQSAERYNANKIQKTFINILNGMGFPTTKYNDLKYRDVIDFSKLKLIIRQKQSTDLLVDSLSYLLNSDKIVSAQKWGETYSIPDEQFENVTNKSNEYIAWLMHDKKIQFGWFYQVATEFFDASNLDTRKWLHFSYYLAVVNAYPAVCFKLKKINPAEAIALLNKKVAVTK